MKKATRNVILFVGLASMLTYGGYHLSTNIDMPTRCDVTHEEIYDIENTANLVVAHRGLSSIFVENSYESALRAFEDPAVSTVEIDIRLTKDNQIILLHDPSVDSLTNGRGNVRDLTLSEIKSLNYFSRNLNEYQKLLIKTGIQDPDFLRKNGLLTEIATFDEILSIDTDKTLLVDIKFEESNASRLIAELANKIKNYKGNMNFIFQSTHGPYLKVLEEFLPGYQYQLIVSSKKSFQENFNKFDYFAANQNIVDQEMIDNIYNNGKELSVWTIDDKKQYDRIYEMAKNHKDEVVYISDFPDCIAYWLGQNKKNDVSNSKCLKKER